MLKQEMVVGLIMAYEEDSVIKEGKGGFVDCHLALRGVPEDEELRVDEGARRTLGWPA